MEKRERERKENWWHKTWDWRDKWPLYSRGIDKKNLSPADHRRRMYLLRSTTIGLHYPWEARKNGMLEETCSSWLLLRRPPPPIQRMALIRSSSVVEITAGILLHDHSRRVPLKPLGISSSAPASKILVSLLLLLDICLSLSIQYIQGEISWRCWWVLVLYRSRHSIAHFSCVASSVRSTTSSSSHLIAPQLFHRWSSRWRLDHHPIALCAPIRSRRPIIFFVFAFFG